jgi:putative membrane protein (TIGR04086 family)
MPVTPTTDPRIAARSRVMARIHWGAVRAGATLSLAVLAITIAAFEVLDRTAGIAWRSNWVFVFYVVAFAGLAAGGWRAARRRMEAPLLHGVLAALVAYVVVAVVGVVVNAVRGGDTVDPVALAFNAMMAAAAGTVGTLIAERRPVAS